MYSKHSIICLIPLILLLVFPSLTYGAPVITINTYPNSVVSGEEFETSFSVLGLTPEVNYYAKSLGGIDFNEVDTWNSAWLQQNEAWASMPVFISNPEGSASATIKSRFGLSTLGGNKEYIIRIRKTDSSTNYDSNTVTIIVVTPQPTITPTTTPTQTAISTGTTTPTSTPTKTATAISAKTATATPKPTITATPIDTETPTNSPDSESQSDSTVTDIKVTSTPEGIVAGISTEKKSPILPIFFIFSGVGFLSYGGYSLYKRSKPEYNSNNETS